MNCQIVCCPGLNDDAQLQRSMEDLAALYPHVRSVSIVPVGITKFREGLYPLTAFTKEHAAETLDQVEAFGDKCIEKYGERIFFCGDEMYLKAGIELPEGGTANLAAHIRIEGEIPEKVIDRITALSYSGDSVSAVSSKAINAYVADNEKNLGSLSRYAKELGLYKRVMDLMEVMLNG
jgi:NifB/MoaA-like Fe-S oxidoreductase